MQVVEISSVTGTSPYDIVICDITNTYCYTVEIGVISIPPTLYINLPDDLIGVDQVIVKIIDSSGCEDIQLITCPPTPTPTPTTTVTPTITPTNANCVCLTFDNPTGIKLNYGYTNCEGVEIYYGLNSLTTINVCGKNPLYDDGIILTVGSYCIGEICPSPTPTPTPTQTLTPSMGGIVGSFVTCCDSSMEFKISNIPSHLYPLSGVYYIVSSGFEGCATYIPTTTSTNIYACSLIGSQPDCFFCDISHPDVLCPTSTPTPTATPTNTITQTPTNTSTPTLTPAPIMCFEMTSTFTPNDLIYQCNINYLGYLNGRPYYGLTFNDCTTSNSQFVSWNIINNRWELTNVLGTFLYQYNNNPSYIPFSDGTYPWMDVSVSGTYKILTSSIGSCPTPTPTSTPTPTVTETPTNTPTITSSNSGCVSYTLNPGFKSSPTYSFTPCCTNVVTSPVVVSLFTGGREVCSSTVPVIVSGVGSYSVNGACEYCGDCYCWDIVSSESSYGWNYIDCDGNPQFVNTTSSICSSSSLSRTGPLSVFDSITRNGLCISGVCPTPTPTPTPTITPTPTTTPLSVVCFGYMFSGDTYNEVIYHSGYYNGYPYYTLTNGFVWYDTNISLWVWSTILGGGTTLDTLNNLGYLYPQCCLLPTYPTWDNINSPTDFMSESSVGGCA